MQENHIIGGKSFSDVFKIIELERKKPVDEKDFLHMYLSIEKYITETHGISKESLRQSIKRQFNTQWLESRIKALFNSKEPDKVIFSEVLLQSIINSLIKNTSQDSAAKTISNIIKDTQFRFIPQSNKIIIPENFYHDKNKEISLNEIYSFMKKLNSYLALLSGASLAKKIFSEAFDGINERYAGFPMFTEAVRSLPKGILDMEKYSLLTKEELERVSRKLAKIDVMKSEFTNIAAHELETPLVPIKGFLSLMQKSPKKYGLKKKGREYIDICLRNVERLDNLIRDILDISKLEAGEMKFEFKNISLSPLLKNAVAESSSTAKNKTIKIKLHLQKKLPQIYADSQRIGQVLSNLIRNAIKFMDKGAIDIKAHVVDGNLEINVEDEGMGIKKQDLPRLFTKFFQTQEAATRKTKGTGLGLAICKNIITAHGGRIWAESSGLGKGSRFIFTLPIQRVNKGINKALKS
jgi:signal transduction histidine kinase